MTTSTLAAASAALDSLLSGTRSDPTTATTTTTTTRRRKKSSKKTRTVAIDAADLDPAARALQEAEEKRRVEEAVKALRKSARIKKEEIEVRERILAMRDARAGKKGKKRKAAVADLVEDSD